MKRLVSMVAARLFVCTALASSLASAPRYGWAAEAPKTGTTNADGTTPEKETKPVATALAGGGFALDFKVWRPPNHAAAKSLTVTYKWGKAGTRTVAAQRQGVHWHVEFPDQPAPNEQASLKLRYAFELSTEDKAALTKAAKNLARAILKATVVAAEQANPPKSEPATSAAPAGGAPTASGTSTPSTPDFPTALNAALQPIGASVDAKTLARYGTSAGEDGFVFVLGELGVSLSANGSYSLVPGGKLQQAASSFRIKNPSKGVAGLEKALAAAKPEAADQDCVQAVGPAPLDEARARNALQACSTTLDNAASKLLPPIDKARLEHAHLLKTMAHAEQPDLRGIGGLSLEISDEPRLENSYSLLAVRLASVFLQSAQTTQTQAAAANALVAGIETAFEDGSRLEDGSTLVEANSQPRRYDIATGAVFVAGIEDIVVPMLISICPAQGCLTAKDMAWRAPNGGWRMISIDAGIRAKTLDTQDRRQSDIISFLTGVSINPVSVLRLSTGFYWFENAQTQSWTGQPYVGVTLNVLNAAEILGGLGMGDQVGPATQPIK